MATPERRLRCVLCQTCANWKRGASQERRRSSRICVAGKDPTANMFECASYVDRLLFRMPLRPAKDWRRAV